MKQLELPIGHGRSLPIHDIITLILDRGRLTKEDVVPWKYRSWDRKRERMAEEGDQSSWIHTYSQTVFDSVLES